jgi:hypothetical protein
VNKELIEIVLIAFTEVINHDKATRKEEYFIIQKDDPTIE